MTNTDLETCRLKLAYLQRQLAIAVSPEDRSILEQIIGDAELTITRLELLNNLSHSDDQIRCQAVLALGNLGDEEAIPKLCHSLLHDSSPEVRRYVAAALGKLAQTKNIANYRAFHKFHV